MSKNHRDIPTDSLWRPSIHDGAPEIKRLTKKQKRKGKSKKRNSPNGWWTYLANTKRAEAKVFYRSPEWLQVRYRALKLHGRKCMACGTTEGRLHVDHIKPRSRYPALALELTNMQVLCEDCNLGKGAWDSTDWRK